MENLRPHSSKHKVACGRLAGRSHLANNMPCQDYVEARKAGSLGCMALADGAGSRSHSEIGAKVSVRAVLRLLLRDFDALYEMALENPSAISQRAVDVCLAALARKARSMKCDIQDFGCTLMFVAHKSGRYIAGHCGDGIIAMHDQGEIVSVLSHPDNGEYLNTTMFVTEPDAPLRFRIYVGECDSPGFALMSDGTAESLYLRATRSTASVALMKLFDWTRTLPKSRIEGILEANLVQAFSKRTTDDCSIGLMVVI